MGKQEDTNARDVQELRRARLAALRLKSENTQCVDCGARSPTWAAVHHGCFLCMDCAARHRKMGVHISFVRSTTLDSWSEEHTVQMEVGGNARALAFWKRNGMDSVQNRVERYHHSLSTQYRSQITKLASASTTPAPKRVQKQSGEEEGAGSERKSPELPEEAAGSEAPPGPPADAASQQAPAPPVAATHRPKPTRASDLTGTIGRRPRAQGKKGLGGRKVPAGSVKEAALTAPSPADQQPAAAPAPAPAPVPAAPLPTSTPPSKQRKPDFSGIGSGSQGSQRDAAPAGNLFTSGERSVSGADFTGIGTQTSQDVNLEAVGWAVGQAFSNANVAITQKIDRVGGQMKSFLDDL